MNQLARKAVQAILSHKKSALAVSVQQAFVFMIPIFMIGATALMLQSFPIASVRTLIQNAWGGVVNEFLGMVYTATYGFAAVYLLISLSYSISLSAVSRGEARVLAVLSSVICYFAFLGPKVYGGGADLLEYTKMSNLFSALLVSLSATKLYFWFYRLFHRVKGGDRISLSVRSIRSIFPITACLAIFAAAGLAVSAVPGIDNFNDLLALLIRRPFESIGATYWGGFIIMLCESLLWMFGIHGGNVFDNLLTAQDGTFAFQNGQIMSKAFTDTYALMGGCGMLICLLPALWLFSRDRKKKKLCRLAGVPMLFNINEILVFGLPVVLNPIYFIPFLAAPLAGYSVAYLATYLGWVPQIVNADVQWTTPVLISGYQATGSIAGSILQGVLLLLGVLIYLPFVRLDNRISEQSAAQCADRLTEICHEREARGLPYASETQSVLLHSFEDDIAVKLGRDIDKGEILLHYQPLVRDGRPVAAEALLRFRYNDRGRFLYPPLVVGIAEENELFEPMTRVIVRRALEDLRQVQKISPDFKITVNLPMQFLLQSAFRRDLIGAAQTSGVRPKTFGIEITEDLQLSDTEDYQTIFDELRGAGIEILMDDFSMGHTSVSLLQKNYFDYIKIDGNLIRRLENERSQSIVSSIVALGHTLHLGVVAEYVETETQRDRLLAMGCHLFQGYLYYKDMPIADLLETLRRQ